MLNYVPERIYDKIKDDPEFIELTNIINNRFSNLSTLLDVVMFDTNAKADVFTYNMYRDTMMHKLVDKYCPEYSLQMDITLTDKSKDELLFYYDDRDNLDSETLLYVLSYLIANSYEDHTFSTYQKKYVEEYENSIIEDRNDFSDYIHLKYINCKVETFAMFEASQNENYLDEVIDLLKVLYDQYKTIVRSIDTLKYCFIEILDHTLTNAFLYVNNDSLIYNSVMSLTIPEEFDNGDFKGTSINELGILDKKFELAVSTRNWEDAINLYKEILDWIDGAMSNPTRLFNTLRIFDKIMAPNFCAILRRYLRLSINFFNREGDRSIALNPQDEEFILRVRYDGTKLSNSETTESFNRLTSHIDDWFTNNKIALLAFRDWYYNIHLKGLKEDEYVQLPTP